MATVADDGSSIMRHTEGHNPADERWQERERKVICSN